MSLIEIYKEESVELKKICERYDYHNKTNRIFYGSFFSSYFCVVAVALLFCLLPKLELVRFLTAYFIVVAFISITHILVYNHHN